MSFHDSLFYTTSAPILCHEPTLLSFRKGQLVLFLAQAGWHVQEEYLNWQDQTGFLHNRRKFAEPGSRPRQADPSLLPDHIAVCCTRKLPPGRQKQNVCG